MKVVLQRSKEAKVEVDGKIVGKIPFGLVVLVGFTHTDTEQVIDEMVDKLIHLRVFDDEFGVMNRSIIDVKGSILSVSQFTLYADTKKGRRPSYKDALGGEESSVLYEKFNKKLEVQNVPVATGIFGAHMNVSLENDGPVTIILER